jgi:hypothetical protein
VLLKIPPPEDSPATILYVIYSFVRVATIRSAVNPSSAPDEYPPARRPLIRATKGAGLPYRGASARSARISTPEPPLGLADRRFYTAGSTQRGSLFEGLLTKRITG